MYYWVPLIPISQTIPRYRLTWQIRGFGLRCLFADGTVSSESISHQWMSFTQHVTQLFYVFKAAKGDPKQTSGSCNHPQLGVKQKAFQCARCPPPPTSLHPRPWKMLAIHFSLERLYSFTLNHWEATNTGYISGQCGFDCVITVDVRCPGNQTLYFSRCCPTGVGVLGNSTVANLIAYTDLYYYSIYSPNMETSTQQSSSYHFIRSNTHTHTTHVK